MLLTCGVRASLAAPRLQETVNEAMQLLQGGDKCHRAVRYVVRRQPPRWSDFKIKLISLKLHLLCIAPRL